MGTDWSESEFSDTLLGVFDYYDIGYRTEVPLDDLGDSTGSKRKMDVYIPNTDTAIELKGPNGDLDRGLGQAMNYTRVCKESILMLDGEARETYRLDTHRTCQIAPGVHFAMVIPSANPCGTGSGLDVRTDSRADLFHEMLYNDEWDDDVAVLKQLIPECIPHEERRWTLPAGNQSLTAYQQNGDLKRAIMGYVESSNAPVSLEEIVENVHQDIDGVEKYDTTIYDAFHSLCKEKRIIKLNSDNYVDRFDPDS